MVYWARLERKRRAFANKEIAIVKEIIRHRQEGLNAFSNGSYFAAQRHFQEIIEYNKYDKNANYFYKKAGLAQQYKDNIFINMQEENTEKAEIYFNKLKELNPNETRNTYRLPAAK